ncbi:hypothetical protein PENTCL1PPCAC_10139 [Pristionchus entomophagus]|uniref:G protein-coupled receptor n=1 Tax=Pristionchus entomophagus TaxID=358040 RepID=A0AAV5SYH3_9BILA|nr:hypothetical protein PENTCL1PPCAC_10139 [Pristionchus entomophagus]
MLGPPVILSIIHYSACSISLIFGSILLLLLIFYTPSHLNAFAVLLRTVTVIELSTSLAAALVFPRIIPLGLDAAAGVINGSIKLMTKNLSISWIFYTCELHGTLQYNVFMSVCYCYRYYVLRRAAPSVAQIHLFASIIFIISFVLYVLFGLSRASPDDLGVYINYYVSQYDIELNETFGVVNVLNSLATPAIVWTVLTACVLSVVNVSISRTHIRYLKYNSEHLSEQTRASHKQFFIALTLQAIFGQLLLLSAGGYAMEQLNLLRSPFLEYGTHMTSEIAISTSPVITLSLS